MRVPRSRKAGGKKGPWHLRTNVDFCRSHVPCHPIRDHHPLPGSRAPSVGVASAIPGSSPGCGTLSDLSEEESQTGRRSRGGVTAQVVNLTSAA